MAKKSAKRKTKATTGTKGKKFSMRGLHRSLDATLGRLKAEKKTKKRDELIALVGGLRAATPCPQLMLIDLGV